MRSRRTKTFRDSLDGLSDETKEAVAAKYELFRENQNDRVLRRKTIKRLKTFGTFIEVRITWSCRAIAEARNGDDYLWIFVGPHSGFDRFVANFRR